MPRKKRSSRVARTDGWPGRNEARRIWMPCPRTLLGHSAQTISTFPAPPALDFYSLTRHPNFSNSQRFNALPLHSNDMYKVIDTQCTFVLFSLVFPNQSPRPLPRSLEGLVSFQFASIPVLSANHCPQTPAHHPPKLFRINTYEISGKCCKQRTYRITKFFRCNTYEKQGGGGCYG